MPRPGFPPTGQRRHARCPGKRETSSGADGRAAPDASAWAQALALRVQGMSDPTGPGTRPDTVTPNHSPSRATVDPAVSPASRRTIAPTSPAGAPLANARAPPRAASSMRIWVTPAADPASSSASNRTTEGKATANSAVTAPRQAGAAPRLPPTAVPLDVFQPVHGNASAVRIRFRRNPRTSSLRMMNTRTPANPTAARVAMAYSAVAIPAWCRARPCASAPLHGANRAGARVDLAHFCDASFPGRLLASHRGVS